MLTSVKQSANNGTSNSKTGVSAAAKFRLGGLDGIRALAAVAVLLYHTYPQLMPGGFVGVDVFFVLSGFLITGLLEREYLKTGQLNLRKFWLRRFRRLFPAVFTTVLVCLPLAYLVDSDLLTRIKSQVIGSLTFTYNWIQIWQHQNYFDSNYLMLFTNMWTLAVEQQFYLLWPLVLLLLWRLPKNSYRLAVLGLVGAVSVAWMQYLVTTPDLIARAYMGTFSHGFGLIFGAFLALLLGNVTSPAEDTTPALFRILWGFIAIIAAVGVTICFFLINDKNTLTYPWLMLLVVFLTMLVIRGFVAPMQNGFGPARLLRRGLDSRLLVWLGERSYGIYLWHWPLFVIYDDCFRGSSHLLKSLVILGVSILMAAISYRWVETPMRFNGIFPTIKHFLGPIYHKPKPGTGRRILLTWLMALLCMGLLGGSVWIFLNSKESSQLEQELNKQQAVEKQAEKQAQTSKNNKGKPSPNTVMKTPVEELKDSKISGENIIVVGDSVTAGAASQAEEKWPGIIFDGKVNRSSRIISGLLKEYKSQGKLRHYVIVGAGTNGNILKAEIEDWLNIIGPDRKLILINAFGPERISWISQSNQAIAEAAVNYPERVYIADWQTQAKEHLDELYRDEIHPQPSGVKYYLKALEDALKQAHNGNRVRVYKF